MSINNIQDELRDLNSDLPQNNNPFHIPEGYFEGLADSVLSRIKMQNISAQQEITELSPLLSNISRKMPYQVPGGYFDANIQGLPSVFADEEVPEFLKAAGKEMPFHLPADYFKKLPDTVLSKLSHRSAKIIPMFAGGWKKMAVAAMITAIIGVSGVFFLNNKASSKDPIAQIKNASTNDIEAFLRNTGASLSGSVTAQNSVRTSEIQSMIQNVPDNEVDAFLKQVPEEESITN